MNVRMYERIFFLSNMLRRENLKICLINLGLFGRIKKCLLRNSYSIAIITSPPPPMFPIIVILIKTACVTFAHMQILCIILKAN